MGWGVRGMTDPAPNWMRCGGHRHVRDRVAAAAGAARRDASPRGSAPPPPPGVGRQDARKRFYKL
eukprot:gene35210-34746_t